MSQTQKELSLLNSSSSENIKSRGLYYGWVIVGTCFFVISITFGAHYSFGIFLNHFRESLRATAASVSGAYSIAVFFYVAFGVPAGWVGDRFGPKITTLLGGVFLGLGLVLTSQVKTVWQLYISYGLVGIGMSPNYSPLMSMISKWFIKRRGLALGITTTGMGAGPLIMAPIASYLIAKTGWRNVYLILASTAALILPASFLLKGSPDQRDKPTERKSPQGNVHPVKPDDRGKLSHTGGFSLGEALKTKVFWLIASIYLMIGLCLHMVMAHVVAYSQRQGLPPLTASAVLSTIGGFSIAGRMIMGLISDWIGRQRALAICMGFEGIMIFWLIGASSPWMFFLFAIVFGFFFGGHVPQMPALVGDNLGLAHMGVILGAASLFWGLGGIIGPVLAGYFVDTTGSYSSAFTVGGLAMLLGSAISLLMERFR